jgi:hypothetical protein
MSTVETQLKVVGPMPPFYKIAEALWGSGTDYDSDGDSETPDSTNWTELTLTNRQDIKQRIDIDPSEKPDHIFLRGSSENLVVRVQEILREYGAIS